MHPMAPVELRGTCVSIEPLRLDHAAGILAAADMDEVFAWLPYSRPTDLVQLVSTRRRKLLLMEHAFETLALERVAFRTDIRNERSQRAIERLGASKEGVHRHEMRRRDGSWRDSVHYSILRSEWPDAKDRLRDRIGVG
jgi:GNAT acetyltransferase-like protein